MSFVQAFQQNLNQLYMNQKAVADMGYTNNVHVHVMRQIIQERLEISDEEYKELCDRENTAREAIQQQQQEEAARQQEELKQKQAEAAAAQLNAEGDDEPLLASERTDEPIIFGGDVGKENQDAGEDDQGSEVDAVQAVQHGDGTGGDREDEGERGEESLPL